MKNPLKIFTTLILLLTLTFVSAQEKSLLWEVSGKGLNQPSYIFGTIHLICPDYTLASKVSKAIQKSSDIYLELDMDDPNLLTEMQRYSLNEGMKNFGEELTPYQKEKINAFLAKNYGMSLQQLGVLKPFAVMSMILMKNAPCDSVSSVEQLVINEVKKKNTDIKGLESVAYQMSLFDSVSIDDQISWILDVLDSTYSDQLNEMIIAYKDEDLESLEEIIYSSPGYEDYVDLLLNDRNKEWIVKMDKQIKTTSTFYAVGAGHLPGDEGIISLLREEGYTVKPVQ